MIRLSKQLSSVMKLCSRREADEWISLGNLFVNETPVTELGFKVALGDQIRIRNDPTNRTYVVKPAADSSQVASENPALETTPRVFLANKLVGEILDVTKPTNLFSRIFSLGAPKGLVVCSHGLDVMCSGVVLLTDSRKLAQLLEYAEPLNQIYHVTCVGKSQPDKVALRWMGSGRAKFGNQYLPAMSSTILQSKYMPKEGNYRTAMSIAFRGGKFKNVKSVFASIGMQVVEAERSRLGPSAFSTHELKPGELCELQPKYIKGALERVIPNWQLDMKKDLDVLVAERRANKDAAAGKKKEA